MSMFWSPSAKGFFAAAVHDVAMPDDAQPISDAEYAALLAAQAVGQEIRSGDEGAPLAVTPTPPAPPTAWFVPVPLLRQRLQAAGLWETAAAALAAQPAAMLHLLTLELGVTQDNAQALAMLRAVGADPADILARP